MSIGTVTVNATMEPMQYCRVSGDAWLGMTQAHYIFNLPKRDLAFRVQMVYGNFEGIQKESRIPQLNVCYKDPLGIKISNQSTDMNNFTLFAQFSKEEPWQRDPLREAEIPSDLADKIENIAKAILAHYEKYQDIYTQSQEEHEEAQQEALGVFVDAFEGFDFDNDFEDEEKMKEMEAKFTTGVDPRRTELSNDPHHEAVKEMQQEIGLEFQTYVDTKLGIKV